MPVALTRTLSEFVASPVALVLYSEVNYQFAYFCIMWQFATLLPSVRIACGQERERGYPIEHLHL